MTTPVDYATVVQELYIAYFGRPADANGLTNFENALLAANAPADVAGLNSAYNSSATVKGLVDAFGLSGESARLYPATDTSNFVKAIFNNILNRDPLPAGLTFWSDAIDHQGLSRGNAALAIMSGALQNSSAPGLLDATAIAHKVAVAASFTSSCSTASGILYYSGANAAASARDMLHLVTNATDTGAFQATIDSTVALLPIIATPPSVPSGASSEPPAVVLVGVHSHDAGLA